MALLKKFSPYLLLTYSLLYISACSTLVTNPTSGIPDDFYIMPKQQHYYSHENDTIQINAWAEKQKVFLFNLRDTLFITSIDTTTPFKNAINYVYPFYEPHPKHLLLINNSYDMDVFTTPFKFRFATDGIPLQITTSFNAAVYAGIRSDFFTIKNHPLKTPVHLSKINNIGCGVGVFGGISSANIKPEFVRNTITYEYDAVSLNYGLAFLFGYKKISTGVAIGYDYLADKNRNNWIYQNKPWLGVFIGLNIN
ncbi:MAG: hypothetical protein H7296_00870 [Bacteroidia bacterium]|nr:hypothetical protein [Bacteroidia bacterium]